MPNCFFAKQPGGVLVPADDETAEYLTTIKTGSYLKVSVKKCRNYEFHKKAFKFLNFCFAHWCGDIQYQFLDEKSQFNTFRKQLTILAGFKIPVVNLRTKTASYEAMSLAFDEMDEDTFRAWYQAAIQAAMFNVFRTDDQDCYNKLVGFF